MQSLTKKIHSNNLRFNAALFTCIPTGKGGLIKLRVMLFNYASG